METFLSIKELRNKYFTQRELVDLLIREKFLTADIFRSSHYFTISRWEKLGIFPIPKRVMVGKISWRVYSKDGKDFEKILEILNKHTRKQVVK